MKNKNIVLKLILAITLIIMIYFIFEYSEVFIKTELADISFDSIRSTLLSYGSWSVIVYILIYVIRPIVFVIPLSLLAVVSGTLYGPLLGIIYTMVGAFLSSTIAFCISRYLGKDFVNKILKGKAHKLGHSVGKSGFKIVVFMRLIVFFPFDAISYVFGLTKIKYTDFIIATLLGIIPEMVAYNYLGINIHNPLSTKTIITFLAIVCLMIVSWKVKIQKEKN